MDVNYSALSELHGLGVPYQGRRAFTLFGAWLSYSAPSALACPLAVIFRAFGAGMPPGCHIPRLRRMPRAVIFRAFGAGMPRAVIFRAFGAGMPPGCHIPRLRRWHAPWLSYSAPSALALTTFLFKANNDH